jgi:ubiquinone/menaquinone biosynthesis C-methylase UbiE
MANVSPAEQEKDRLERERKHGLEILKTRESNWGWNTPAGRIRWQRRLDFLRTLDLEPTADVLEIGAGTGTFTEGLVAAFPRLTAIDISPDLLEAARRKIPNARFLCMDAHDLEFQTGAFDAVVGCSVLHHLSWSRALKEFFRVLKPGGVIRFSEPNLLNPQIFLQKNIPLLKRLAGDSPDEYAFTATSIVRDLRDAGFSQATAEAYEFLHPSVPAALITAVTRLESALMRTPLRHIGGSLLIRGRKPLGPVAERS